MKTTAPAEPTVARERGCEPAFTADEAGCQPVDSGGVNPLGGAPWSVSPRETVGPYKRAVASLREEVGVHERVQRVSPAHTGSAEVRVQRPAHVHQPVSDPAAVFLVRYALRRYCNIGDIFGVFTDDRLSVLQPPNNCYLLFVRRHISDDLSQPGPWCP